MGASHRQSCRDDPHPMVPLLGSCCPSFQPVFHSWGNSANGTWMECMEGGWGGCPLCACHAAQLLVREALVMFFTPSVSKQFQFPPPQLSFPKIWSIWTIRYSFNQWRGGGGTCPFLIFKMIKISSSRHIDLSCLFVSSVSI